ncbi:MAG: sigma-70 family RNA polymerase sigma factor [Spirochaetales bacterium]|nr:sigma-70 family RNA polymerase sigma factor [Spirochaetales bacterium]
MDKIGMACLEWQQARKGKKRKLEDRLFRLIWEHYHPRLQVFLSSLPPEEKEDRVSEILLKVFESLESYRGDYAFSTWLYRIARNSEIDRYRRKGPVPVEWEEEIHSPREKETPESLMLRQADRELLVRAMDSLKRTERELLYLAYYEELPYRDISRIVGRPVGTVKYEMHRIRALLKERLKEDFDEAE